MIGKLAYWIIKWLLNENLALETPTGTNESQ